LHKDKEVELSKEILKTLTMEDLWKSPRLKKLVEKKYPRAYSAITKPYREFGLYNFIKLAESQKSVMQEAIDLGSIEKLPISNIDSALKVIKWNKLKVGKELWVGGVPFKFELSRFVKHYASEKTYEEWRQILKDIGATKSNMERILEQYNNKFKNK
tara:strand:- start:137 stop:607 length:471 start_codon:yes stop_codon:yes gene_type:complete